MWALFLCVALNDPGDDKAPEGAFARPCATRNDQKTAAVARSERDDALHARSQCCGSCERRGGASTRARSAELGACNGPRSCVGRAAERKEHDAAS